MSTFEIKSESLVPLALLDTMGGELEGKTRLQKLAFLLDEDELGDRFDAYTFRKYDYGPFSKTLLDNIEALERKGLVEISQQRTVGGNTRHDYQLTDLGEDIVSELADRNGDEAKIFEAAKKVVLEHGDRPLRDLIEHVYEEHPKYTKNSVYQY